MQQATSIEKTGTEEQGSSITVKGDRIAIHSWSGGDHLNEDYDVKREDLKDAKLVGELHVEMKVHLYHDACHDGFSSVGATRSMSTHRCRVPINALKYIFGPDCLQNQN